MALTTIDSSSNNTSQYISQYTMDILYQATSKVFFNPVSGPPGSGMPIIVKADLTVKKGGTIYIDMANALTGSGKSGENQLSGNEEAATFSQLSISPTYKRNAIAFHEVSAQNTIHDLRRIGVRQTSEWLAGQIDDTIFDALDAQTYNSIYGGNATSKATLESTHVLTTGVIDRAVSKALDENVRPLNIGGRDWFIMIISHHQAYDLRRDSDWLAAQHYAGIRGLDNPIFSGAMGAWNDVLLFVNNRVGRGSDAGSGSNVNYATGHLLGQNAAGFGWAMYPDLIEETRDFGAVYGVGAKAFWGAEAAVFNTSEAIGHVPVWTAATNPNA